METTNSRGKRRHDRAFREELAARLVEAELSAEELARTMEMSLAELAEWLAKAGNARAVQMLARLTQFRTQLLLERFRAGAAVRLYQLASSDEPTELARRACVDLLRTQLHAPDPPPASDETTSPRAPDEHSILAALEALGREEE